MMAYETLYNLISTTSKDGIGLTGSAADFTSNGKTFKVRTKNDAIVIVSRSTFNIREVFAARTQNNDTRKVLTFSLSNSSRSLLHVAGDVCTKNVPIPTF